MWFDRQSLYVGDEYRSIIEKEIQSSDYVVAILSSSYSRCRFQHFELERAFAEHERRTSSGLRSQFLLPVFLSPVIVEIQGFDSLHHIDLTADIRGTLVALRSRIKHSFPTREIADARVLCQSHIANFRGIPRDAYFLKVANVSTEPFSVTHAWIEVLDEEWFFEYPECRPVPSPVLTPGQEWETFIFCEHLPNASSKTYFEAFRIRLSNGDVYKSYKNNNVAAYGKIAGGPLAPDELPRIVRMPL